jgi:hypothetical protein
MCTRNFDIKEWSESDKIIVKKNQKKTKLRAG